MTPLDLCLVSVTMNLILAYDMVADMAMEEDE
jgi:hypothetical protein